MHHQAGIVAAAQRAPQRAPIHVRSQRAALHPLRCTPCAACMQGVPCTTATHPVVWSATHCCATRNVQRCGTWLGPGHGPNGLLLHTRDTTPAAGHAHAACSPPRPRCTYPNQPRKHSPPVDHKQATALLAARGDTPRAPRTPAQHPTACIPSSHHHPTQVSCYSTQPPDRPNLAQTVRTISTGPRGPRLPQRGVGAAVPIHASVLQSSPQRLTPLECRQCTGRTPRSVPPPLPHFQCVRSDGPRALGPQHPCLNTCNPPPLPLIEPLLGSQSRNNGPPIPFSRRLPSQRPRLTTDTTTGPPT
jgi:hypothetical protein